MNRSSLLEKIISNVTKELLFSRNEEHTSMLRETLFYYCDLQAQFEEGEMSPFSKFVKALKDYEYPYLMLGHSVTVEAPLKVVLGLLENYGLNDVMVTQEDGHCRVFGKSHNH